MGKHYLRCGDLERAEQALRRSVARLVRLNPNPADGESHYQLGRALDLAGRVDGAYDAYFKATWNAAWAAPGYHRLAEIACRRGEWELALEHVERSLIKSADNLGALGLKALLLRQLGREEEGRALAATTLTMDPLDVWARMIVRQETPRDGQQCLDLCFDLLRAGFRSQVHALLTESLRMDAAGVEGSRAMRCYLLASVARAMGMHVEAEQDAKSARESDTNYVFPHRIEEMLLLEEALRMDSRDARAHLALGNLLYDKGRREEAIAHWRDAADLEPELAVAWRNLGLGLYNVSRDAAGALAAYACARRAAPQDARLLYEEYQLRSRIGEPASSLLAYLETAWPLVLRRDDLTLEAAALLNSLRRPQDALELLLSRQFQPWEGGEGRVLGQYMRALILLAREALRNGDARSAVERLEQALRPPHCLAEALHVLQNTSDVAYWLGVSYEMAGDMEAARKQWERAAARRADFREMSMAPVSGTTYWSGMALRALGREVEAEETFREMETYAAKLRSETAKIDYFATSLPNMLLFEDDIDARQKTEAMFLAALAAIGTGRGDARAELAHVLLRDQNHAGALDVLWLSER
jgi:tetratricopeptide (TPR) repeat protein